jgi:peroxiredoxin
MSVLLLGSRLFLAGVFAAAGSAKLADRGGTRESLERFGAPRRLLAGGAVALPALELAVAAALVPEATAWWGATGGLVLLVVFSAAVGRLLLRGEEADCHCFGALHSTPADRRVLLRNAGLASLAVFVLAAGAGDPGPDPGVTAGIVVLGLAGAGLAAFAWMVLGQNGHLLRRIDAMESELRSGPTAVAPGEPAPLPKQGLPVGTQVPDFTAHDLNGEPVALAGLLGRGLPLALVFADADCPSCSRLLPSLGPAAEIRRDEFTLCVLTSGSVRGARDLADDYDLDLVLVQPAHALNLTLRAYALPSALMIGVDGTVISEFARGPEAVTAMLEADEPASPLRLEVVG